MMPIGTLSTDRSLEPLELPGADLRLAPGTEGFQLSGQRANSLGKPWLPRGVT